MSTTKYFQGEKLRMPSMVNKRNTGLHLSSASTDRLFFVRVIFCPFLSIFGQFMSNFWTIYVQFLDNLTKFWPKFWQLVRLDNLELISHEQYSPTSVRLALFLGLHSSWLPSNIFGPILTTLGHFVRFGTHCPFLSIFG